MTNTPKILYFTRMSIILCLFLCMNGNLYAQNIFSEWSINSREGNECLYANGENIQLGIKPTNESYLWIFEEVEGNKVRIKNKVTGLYLHLDGSKLSISNDTLSNQTVWETDGLTYPTENCGWYYLSNSYKGKIMFLSKVNGTLQVIDGDINFNQHAHWSFTRENGSLLPYRIEADQVTDASFHGIKSAKAISTTKIQSDYHEPNKVWQLSKNIENFPVLESPNTMLVALYNMALEETLLNIRTDSTFMAGALWPDTWTRDIVYSIYFSYAWLLPEVSRKTLLKQTLRKSKEALQDTGSGGSWPISTDRVVWALAAWEYYLSTGDKLWLSEAYETLRNTAIKDKHVVYNSKIQLFKGETCSMDWRTHTYPDWFTNTTISETYSSGTNALHYFMYKFLSDAAKILVKEKSEISSWENQLNLLKKSINRHFWQEKSGTYSSYLFPDYLGNLPTQKVDIMSNGLCGLTGISSAKQIQKIVENYPLYPYGGATLYPTIPNEFAYHNKSIWPVWQTSYLLLANKAGNVDAVSHIIKSMIRSSALFLTHKENMTYDTGYDRNTALNSDRQLWSVASYLSMIYRVVFGIEMTQNGLTFKPTVPHFFIGELNLKNFKYRNSLIDIKINGTGNKVERMLVNAKVVPTDYTIHCDSEGYSLVEIFMKPAGKPEIVNITKAGKGYCWSPAEVQCKNEAEQLSWNISPDLKYYLYGNKKITPVHNPISLSDKKNGHYSIFSTNNLNFQSDLSKPVLNKSNILKFEAENGHFNGSTESKNRNFSGKGYVRNFSSENNAFQITIKVPKTSDYLLSMIGANGHGPHGTSCAIRSVFVDGKDVGTFILEANGNWDLWTESNHILLPKLKTGEHLVQILYNPENKGFDNNMSFDTENKNDINLDYINVLCADFK